VAISLEHQPKADPSTLATRQARLGARQALGGKCQITNIK